MSGVFSQPTFSKNSCLDTSIKVPTNGSLTPLVDPQIFLNNTSFTGKLLFNLPLITFEHRDGTTTSIHLTYNPLQISERQLNIGSGWGLAKNCIRCDSAKNQYSITIQGTEFLLDQKPQNGSSKTLRFAMNGSDVVVLLDPTQSKFQLFKVGGYVQTYEKKDTLENQWLLSDESLPDSSRLTYSYDIVQGAVYLKEISHSDNKQLIRLTYDVTRKFFELVSLEIQTLNHPPASLQVDLSDRTITLIEQGGASLSSYSYLGNNANLIQEVALPILKVSYTYSSQNVNHLISDNQSYSLQGIQPRIFYGADYIIGAYLDESGYLILEKCEGETWTIQASGDIGYTKRFPSLSLGLDTIQSYQVLAQTDDIIVYLSGIISGKIIIFSSTLSVDTVFQPVVKSFDVPSEGVLSICSEGFYLTSAKGCQVFSKKDNDWKDNHLIDDVSYPSIEIKEKGAWIYTDSSLFSVDDLSQPLVKSAEILDVQKNWLAEIKTFAIKLSSDQVTQDQIVRLFSQSLLRKRGNFMVLSTLVLPQDSISRFRTKLQRFVNQGGSFQAETPIDDPSSFIQDNFCELSKKLFPNDLVNGPFTFRRQVFLSTDGRTISVRTRNITILPSEKYENKNLDQIDWTAGVSYSTQQPIQLDHVTRGVANRQDQVDFTLKSGQGNWALSFSNPSFRADLNQGLYTFCMQTSDNQTIWLQPTRIEDAEIQITITKGSQTESITATPANDYKELYLSICSFYTGTNTLTNGEFSGLVENDEALPSFIALAVAQRSASWLAEIDDQGRISCSEWEMNSPQDKPKKISEIKIGDDYFLKTEGSEVSLYQKDGAGTDSKKWFTFPVDSADQIVNFYPSCLVYENKGQINLLCFQSSEAGKPPQPDSNAIEFRNGQLNAAFCYPSNPYFSLAVQEDVSDKNQKKISLYKSSNLIAKTVQQDWVLTGQTLQTSQEQEQIQYIYDSPWQFQNNQIFYRSVSTISFDKEEPQGKTVTTLSGNLVQKIVYDQNGLIIQKDETQTVAPSTEDESAPSTPDFKPPASLTSTLKSEKGNFSIALIEGVFFEDQEADFMSFEAYEIARIGQQKQGAPIWQIDEKCTVQQGWSLSGQQYLKIQEGGKLSVTYKPDNIKQIYSIGIWIRSDKDLPTSCSLSMTFVSEKSRLSAQGVVKNQQGQWHYLEAVLPLVNLSSEETSGTIQVGIQALQSWIDVDNVRFSPLGCALKARVFDPILRVPTGVFDSKGLYQRMIYANQQLVGIIQPNGSVQSLFHRWNPQKEAKLTESLLPDDLGSELTLQPTGGFFEEFDPAVVPSRWNLDLSKWTPGPGQLIHSGAAADQLSLKDPQALKLDQIGCSFECIGLTAQSTITLYLGGYALSLPRSLLQLESVAFLGLRFGSRLILYANGQLVIDQQQSPPSSPLPVSPFAIRVTGPATIKNLMLFERPKVTVEYKNFQNQTIQCLTLVNDSLIQLSANTYDTLQRTTSKGMALTLGPDDNKHLLSYRASPSNQPNISYLYDPAPLPSTRQLKLAETEYAESPAEMLGGTFDLLQTKIPNLMQSVAPWIPSVLKESSYRYLITKDPDGVYSLAIQNEQGQLVASYLQTDTGFIQNRFTYEGKEGKLTRHLLPRYFVLEVGSGDRIDPKNFVRTISYTPNGQLHISMDPDYGRDVRVHDPKSSALRFQVHYTPEGSFGYLLLFSYDAKGCIKSVGYHPNPVIQKDGQPVKLADQDQLEAAAILRAMAAIDQVPDATKQLLADAILLNTAEVTHNHLDLAERGRLQSTFTNQVLPENLDFISLGGTEEYFTHNLSGLITKKEMRVADQGGEISYRYDSSFNLSSIVYPTPLAGNTSELVYEYDHLQRVISVHAANEKVTYLQIEYVGASSSVAVEHIPFANLQRNYTYSEANQLVSIKDQFLEQQLTYTSKAFQEKQTYKQLIASSQFSADWSKTIKDTQAIDLLKTKLIALFPSKEKEVDAFIQILINCGYLTPQGFVWKLPSIHTVYDLPTELLDLSVVIPVLQQHPCAIKTGHQYAYEFAGQLTKAKFAQGDAPIGRFSSNAIAQYSPKPDNKPFTPNVADCLYAALRVKGFVTIDGIWSLQLHDGLQSILEKNTDPGGGAPYLKAHPIGVRNLLIQHYKEGSPLNALVFQGYYFKWTNTSFKDPDGPVRKKESDMAWNWLQSNGFIDATNQVTDKLISEDLKNLLSASKLSVTLTDVVSLIHFYQTYAITESANDVWVFNSDVHGNMSKYYVGSTRYHLAVSKVNNQLRYILTDFDTLTDQKKHLFTHDGNGNVNTAPHLGIQTIFYDCYSNRPHCITMENGSVLQFSYDSKGMRSMKRLQDSQGNVKSEICYLRDETGKVLSESHTDSEGKSVTVSYIYGPLGLAAFIRNGKFYAVLKDHEGSIRGVIDENQQVVFMTHYLPYGQRTQTYGDASILSYGYLGQEFDLEIGLYNLNARLYDPQLGRFYQVDPARQYASPYLYAGNSPISFEDPSGLFSWNSFFGGLVSGLEILGGITIDVLTGGLAAEGIGGMLLGAGISGLSYTIESGDNFSWNKFGEEEGIGAAVGLLTAGLGSVEGEIVEKVTAGLVEGSLKRVAAETATRIVARSVSGIVSGIGQTILENAANGQQWDQGLDRAAWVGALTGASSAAIGTGLGGLAARFNNEESSLLSKGLKQLAIGTVSGFAADATGTLIANAIQGAPLDSGLWQLAINNVTGGIVGAGHAVNPDRPLLISRGLKFVEVATETNCLAVATFKSMEKQGILGGVKDPADLRAIAAQSMKEDLANNPANCREKFKDHIAKLLTAKSNTGLSSELQELVSKAREEMFTTQKSASEIIDEYLKDPEVIDGYIKTYVELIHSGEVWGSFLELDYLGLKLNLKFRVDINGEKWSSIGPQDASHSIYLPYNGEHYDLYYKEGVAFFTKRRRYEPIDGEHGFGAGKAAAKTLKKQISSKLSVLKKAMGKKGYAKFETIVTNYKSDKINGTKFARKIKIDTNIEIAFNDNVIDVLVNKGGSYKDLANRCSFSLLVESNHMPPFSVVRNTFGYAKGDISCVSMYQQDHRNFPSTGRFGGGKLTKGEIDAVKQAIAGSATLPNPSGKIDTFRKYHDYLESLYESSDFQQSYADMMEMEIRVKYLLFGTRYQTGIREAVNYALTQDYIDADQAKHLNSL